MFIRYLNQPASGKEPIIFLEPYYVGLHEKLPSFIKLSEEQKKIFGLTDNGITDLRTSRSQLWI
jgi:hypothetical protein